jgi:hypothetical protein
MRRRTNGTAWAFAAAALAVSAAARADEPKTQPGAFDFLLQEKTFVTLREFRCKTMICAYGETHDWLGVEPLVELPVGGTFSIFSDSTRNALAQWVDSHALTVTLTAGIRVWFANDLFSVSAYFSQPAVTSSNTIHVLGTPYAYPTSNIHRPYPGVALGVFNDIAWIGFDYQRLNNGDSAANADTNYPLNYPVSSTWSLTIGLAVATAAKTGLGALAAYVGKQKEDAKKTDTSVRVAGRIVVEEPIVASTLTVADKTVFECSKGAPIRISASKIVWEGSATFLCTGADAKPGRDGPPPRFQGFCLAASDPGAAATWAAYKPLAGSPGGDATPAGDSVDAYIDAPDQEFGKTAAIHVRLTGGQGAVGGKPGAPEHGEERATSADCAARAGAQVAPAKDGIPGPSGAASAGGRDGTLYVTTTTKVAPGIVDGSVVIKGP